MMTFADVCVRCRMQEALTYLAHAYDTNARLLKNGEKRGIDKSLIAGYRRKCLTVSKAGLTVRVRNLRFQCYYRET